MATEIEIQFFIDIKEEVLVIYTIQVGCFIKVISNVSSVCNVKRKIRSIE